MQWFGTPVPAACAMEQATSRSAISLERNASAVGNLAIVVSNDTNDLELEEEVFKRSKTLRRTPITKRKMMA